MSPSDLTRLREKIQLTAVLDLRNENELAQQNVRPLDGVGFRYFNVPFVTGEPDDTGVKKALRESTNLGQVYSYEIRHREYGKRVVKALEIIAD